jgi:tetratricopeptide (TPR) repeat protein
MRQDASASGNARQVVQGSGIQFIDFHGPASEPPVSIAPPFGRRNKDQPVRGRDDLLDELARAAGDVRIVHGLGGCGKTTLALEVAYQARQRGVEVWWVPAVEPGGLAAGMRTVGRRLGVTDVELDHGDAADVIWHRLSARADPWLLVFDNADDPQVLAGPGRWVCEGLGWMRPLDSPAGQVLVTSRDGSAASWCSWAIRHRLPVLPADEAAQVLLDRAGHEAGSDDEARALADRLGGLPLALRIAGSYLAESAAIPAAFAGPGLIRTFRQYRDALDAGDLDAVFRGHGAEDPSQDEARRLIGRTWELSLDLLDARDLPEARRLLRLLAMFADAPIPYEGLLDLTTLAASPLFPRITGARLWQALRALDDYGLIEIAAGGDGAIPVTQLHPLVRDTSRPRPDAEDGGYAAYLDLAIRLSESVAAADETGVPEDPPKWPIWQLLTPHILHLFDLRPCAVMGADPIGADDPVVAIASAAELVARYLDEAGLYAQAEAVQLAVLSVYAEALGQDHPGTLSIRHYIANLMLNRAEYAEAAAVYREVLAAREQALGPDHQDTLTTRYQLAHTMAEQGDLAAAEAEFRDVLAAESGMLGHDHPDTLTTRYDVAWMTSERGDVAEAEERYREVLAGRLRVLGPDHPHRLSTRFEIARMIVMRGDLAGAEVEYQDLLPAVTRVLGPDHPYVEVAARNLEILRQETSTGGETE